MKCVFTGVLAVLVLPCLGSPATVQGHIHDSHGAIIPGAIVEIHISNLHGPDSAQETRTTRADAFGSYQFLSLPAGTYTLRAKMDPVGEQTVGPFLLSDPDHKTLDLVLKPSDSSIAFFDEPKFTVAGVTDNTYSGGHGSDTLNRSAESLTKAAASLSKPDASIPSGRTEQALREAIDREPNNAALYHRLAVTEERMDKPLEAVRNYQRAAELDPSEPNLFDWGTELLLHRAPEPAIEVFNQGIHLFPSSSRMLLGAAVALYTRGDFAESAHRFFEATDLNPRDPEPYLFLGKVQAPDVADSDGFRDRFTRFANLQPENAWANYYYALCLWRMRKDSADLETRARVQSLLEKAVRLDPMLAAAYLQLGILHSEQNDLPAAIHAFERAVEADPNLEQAHYRLAQAYSQAGQHDKAGQEIARFDELSKTSAQERDRERSELKKFVVRLRTPASN